MFKIKLLILFALSILVYSCSNHNYDTRTFTISTSPNEETYQVRNILIQYLDSMSLYDEINPDYIINVDASFSERSFITNIDKTSDRKRITLKVKYKVIQKYKYYNCAMFIQDYERSSNYIFASGEFNQSNKAADLEIKNNLIDLITNDLLDDIIGDRLRCTYIEPKS